MTELEKSILTRLAFTTGLLGCAAKRYLGGERFGYTPKDIIFQLASDTRFEHCRIKYDISLLLDMERYVLIHAGELPDKVYRSLYKYKIKELDPKEFTYPMN